MNILSIGYTRRVILVVSIVFAMAITMTIHKDVFIRLSVHDEYAETVEMSYQIVRGQQKANTYSADAMRIAVPFLITTVDSVIKNNRLVFLSIYMTFMVLYSLVAFFVFSHYQGDGLGGLFTACTLVGYALGDLNHHNLDTAIAAALVLLVLLTFFSPSHRSRSYPNGSTRGTINEQIIPVSLILVLALVRPEYAIGLTASAIVVNLVFLSRAA